MNLINNILLFGCMGAQQATEGAEGQQGTSWWIIVVYIVIFAAIIYFLMIRPQRKAKKQQESTMNSLEPGDSVLTTSGFYGTVVAINGDTVIVEFGNNKNCRIPMSKQAISQIEKANAGVQAQAATTTENRKKFFGKGKAEAEAAKAEAEAEQARIEAAAADAQAAAEEAAQAADEVNETPAE